MTHDQPSPPPRTQLSPTIKTLRAILPEAGKIKIGGKGEKRKTGQGKEWRLPVKFDHIVITTLERDENDNFKRDPRAIKSFGEKPISIPIELLYDDPAINFPSCLMCYKGSELFCRGDGEFADRQDMPLMATECPCERYAPEYTGKEICKNHGVLSCIIPGLSNVGGVYKFRTTSFNSVQGITSSLLYILGRTGGILRGLPLQLVLTDKAAVSPKTGEKVNIKFLRIEFNGNDDELMKAADKIYELNSGRRQYRLQLESNMKQLAIAEVMPQENDTEKDISEEYYPEDSQNEKENEKEKMPELNINKETGEVSSQPEPVVAPPDSQSESELETDAKPLEDLFK